MIAVDSAQIDRAIHQLRAHAASVPSINELGDDLLATSWRQLTIALLRPAGAIGCYVWAAFHGHWIVAVLLVPVVFVSDVVVVHDLMHSSLGLSRRMNSLLLGGLALLMLDSGHCLAATHQAHHRLYPSTRDPEAFLAGWPLWRVLAAGPTYRYRLWNWAWRHHPDRHRTMVAEIAVQSAIVATAIAAALTGHLVPLCVYVAVATIGSWLFPVVSVTAVHNPHGATELQQSKTLHGRLIPRILLGMGHHLEHHLWPTVPAHHLAETSRRAERLLEASHAAITRVP